MKRTVNGVISIQLSLILLIGLFTFSASAVEYDYGDTSGHWAESSIERWSDYGIVQGNGGIFAPDGQLTRAQMAVILSRLLNLPEAASAGFIDVDENAWYADAINRCYAAGIMLGSNGRAMPDEPIMREQAIVMLCRALGIEPIGNVALSTYADANEVSAYAAGYVAALIESGIVKGVDNNLLAPLSDITRAAIVTILDRAIAVYANGDGATIDASEANGIILVTAKNVTVKNAPAGTQIIVAASAGNATVNGIAVSADTSYTAEKQDATPSAGSGAGGSSSGGTSSSGGSSGGSSSGGSNSGGGGGSGTATPAYTISNLRFEERNGVYVLAWDGLETPNAVYKVYTKDSAESTWRPQTTIDRTYEEMVYRGGVGFRVEAYLEEGAATPISSVENSDMPFATTDIKDVLSDLHVEFTKNDNHYTVNLAGLPANKQISISLDSEEGHDLYTSMADTQGNATIQIEAKQNALVESGKYTVYSYGNYVLNGNQLSYTVYQHCEPTYCIAKQPSDYISNIHFENKNDRYALAWDGLKDSTVSYKVYVRDVEDSNWELYDSGTAQWVYLPWYMNLNGFRIEAYLSGNSITPVASIERTDMSYTSTIVTSKIDTISATFTKNDGRYTASFSGLSANKMFSIDFDYSDRGISYQYTTDEQGCLSFQLLADESSLVENGKYTVYSFGNYVIDGNNLSYTVYQHCDMTYCIAKQSSDFLSNLRFEEKNGVYVLAWNGLEDSSIWYRPYTRTDENSEWKSIVGKIRSQWRYLPWYMNGNGFRVEAYMDGDDTTPIASIERTDLSHTMTKVTSQIENLSVLFEETDGRYTMNVSGLPANKLAVIRFERESEGDIHRDMADAQGSISYQFPTWWSNDLIESGTYTVYSYDNFTLNENQLSYTVYQHCDATPCISAETAT